MTQLGLFNPENLPPRVRYEKLFENLPGIEKRESNESKGRPPVPEDSLLRALVYKALRVVPTLSDLAFELKNNPSIQGACGLDIFQEPPSVERFSSFLRLSPNVKLQKIREKLVKELIEEDVIKGNLLALDSCPIQANVKENNLKTSVANRFEKSRRCAGDPEAKLGIMVQYPKPFKTKICYF